MFVMLAVVLFDLGSMRPLCFTSQEGKDHGVRSFMVPLRRKADLTFHKGYVLLRVGYVANLHTLCLWQSVLR
jgi:hypothetical protein